MAWKLNYTQMIALFEEVDGVHFFMLTFADNLIRDSIYGTVLRVSLGAILSTVDIVTDVYVISTYFSSGLEAQAYSLMVMIFASVAMQMVVVIGNYVRAPPSRLLKEALISLLFLRPAVDAYRVSTNHEAVEESVSSLSEMMYNKAVELATEAIPGCILQCFVYISNPDQAGDFALISIIVSSLVTGFTSAMIAFDMDVDIPHRENQPQMYGFVPDADKLRGRCFALLTAIGTLHSLSRCVGCAIIVAGAGKTELAAILVGEMTIYLLYKIARRDFMYYPRIEGRLAGVTVSFLVRVMSKIVSDFSGCVHFRNPYEMGGTAFSFSMVWTQVFSLVALYFYEDTEGSIPLKGKLTLFLVCSCATWLLLNIIFFCNINESYYHTFFGTTTAPQYTCQLFRESEEDFAKFDAAFTNRMSYTMSIENEIRSRVAENINVWKREKEAWFQIELIPDKYLPEEVFVSEGGIKRRRASFSLPRS